VTVILFPLHFFQLMMTDAQIEDNLRCLLESVMKHSPTSRFSHRSVDWPFLSHVIVECKPCRETFKINYDAILADTTDAKLSSDSESSDESGDEEDSASASPSLKEVAAKTG
jgi:hypothetical protein